MHRRRILLGLAAAVTLATAPAATLAAGKAPVAPDAAAPDAVVKSLYDRLAAEAYDYMTSKALRRRYFTAATSTMIEKVDAKSVKNEEPGIDYDPLIDGQDGEVKNLKIAVTASSADKATVEARFRSFDADLTVVFDMRNEKGVWKIEDIRGREGSSLRAVMRDYLK